VVDRLVVALQIVQAKLKNSWILLRAGAPPVGEYCGCAGKFELSGGTSGASRLFAAFDGI
jgi:hypothetical protein